MSIDAIADATAGPFAAGCAVLAFAGIAKIRRPFSVGDHETVETNVIRATVETARFARRDHRILALLSVKAGFGLAGGVIVLISVFGYEVFREGAVGIGVLMAGRGIGALIGPFIGRWLSGPDDRRLFGVIALSLTVFGFGYALLGLMPSLWLAAMYLACGIAGLEVEQMFHLGRPMVDRSFEARRDLVEPLGVFLCELLVVAALLSWVRLARRRATSIVS